MKKTRNPKKKNKKRGRGQAPLITAAVDLSSLGSLVQGLMENAAMKTEEQAVSTA